MNFLGHLYFSFDNSDLQHANLLGDFIKGSDYKNFPVNIQKGIQLHREIDSFTDQHPVVIDCLHHMYGHLPKISGIAIDMIFDHLLAKNWQKFHTLPLRAFVDHFYQSSPNPIELFPTSYLIMLQRMHQEDWLFRYQFYDGFDEACRNFSKRIPFDNNLYLAPAYFQGNEQELSNAFFEFMKDASTHFTDFSIEHGIPQIVEK